MPQFPLKWIGHEDGWLCGFREGKTQEALRELAALACAGCALTRNSRASWVLGPKWWGEVFQGTVCPGPGHLEGPSLHLCHGEPGVWTTHWGLKKKKKSICQPASPPWHRTPPGKRVNMLGSCPTSIRPWASQAAWNSPTIHSLEGACTAPAGNGG